MKKLIFFFAIIGCLYVPSNSYAQNTFAPIGAEWWYYSEDRFWGNGDFMLLHAKVATDTLIEGKTCQAIQREGIKKTGYSISGAPMQISAADTVPFRTLYTYSNEDTVFIYNHLFAKFTPLYIYNVTPGQTICLPVIPDVFESVNFYNPGFLGDSTFCFIIDSVGIALYDTTHLKTVYTHSLYDENVGPSERITSNWSFASYWDQGMYAEVIGGFHGGILPKPQYERGYFDWTEPTAHMVLNCYHDLVTDIKVSDTACDYMASTLLSVTALSLSSSGVAVYPNPASSVITIKRDKALTEALQVQFTDLAGRPLRSFNLQRNETGMTLDVHSLSNGLYLLKFFRKDAVYYQKIVIQH